MNLDTYFGDWVKYIDKKELGLILDQLEKEYKIKSVEPEQSNVFRAFHLCQYRDLKVVFLGMDPYPQKGVATGILFGNRQPDNNLSPSLEVLKECVIDYTSPVNNIRFDNSLEEWSKQGVLMLNSALTVETNKIGSHVTLWRPFISSLLKKISNFNSGIIFVLFGQQAQSFTPYINGVTNNIIKVKHPSYYVRIGEKMPREWFVEVNKLLGEKYGEEINWFDKY